MASTRRDPDGVARRGQVPAGVVLDAYGALDGQGELSVVMLVRADARTGGMGDPIDPGR